MSQDKLKLTGHVKMVLKDKDGNVKKEQSGKNLVVNAGENLIAAWIGGEAPTAPSHLGIGTDNTAAAAGQTALVGTELDRNALSFSRTDNAVTLSATFGAGEGTGTIEEAGIFNAASAGTMLARWVTSTFVKGASDSLQITWTLTVGS